MGGILTLTGNIVFVVISAAVLLLHWISLPANWILLALAFVYALITAFDPVGWGTLGILAALALLAEGLEFAVGVVYTAKKGASRWGVIGSFVGGMAGGLGCASLAPPAGALFGAFAGSFVGAVLLEYISQERFDKAVASGRAAFFGKVFAAMVKTAVGFWMWILLAYRILFTPE